MYERIQLKQLKNDSKRRKQENKNRCRELKFQCLSFARDNRTSQDYDVLAEAEKIWQFVNS